MQMIFEAKKEEIRKLDDSALRELVGRLCRTEAVACGLGAAAVRYGGDQNAPDGGVDVEVDMQDKCLAGGVLLKGHTYIQVKRPSMPPNAIKTEMCPHGTPRPIFTSLEQENGSYIIVSSGDDLSAAMRKTRIKAMKSALGQAAKSIHVDFLDQSSLAAWCNQYPTVVCWLKHTHGLDPVGWRPYGDWTGSHMDAAYLLDKTARLRSPDQPRSMGILEGLSDIRSILLHGGASVRLTGLSGMGKTRFAQALFEIGVGNDPLSPQKVMYLDRQDTFSIPPSEMIDILQRAKEHAVVVVDNCTAKEHRSLTEKCTSLHSTVSLLTIEYDVQEDEPEDSFAYILYPSSDECICKLLEQRFPGRPKESYRRISRLAGGNARIAIALAKAAPRNTDLSELRDRELFDRLFWQNSQRNDELELTAKVCSLVYSFSIAPQDGCDHSRELACLAELAELSPDTIYRNVSQLRTKQLVQCRGDWRAVLPHALANRLAKEALEEIPIKKLVSQMEQSTSHMLRSFSKRLSYLHDSPQARDIFRYWLTVSPLHAPSKWNAVCQYRLEDAAPVIPGELLTYLENLCADGMRPKCFEEYFDQRTLYHVLIHLAYDPAWFERSVMLLTTISLPPNGEINGSELFQIVYSGTKTPLADRLHVIRRLLLEPPDNDYTFGAKYLGAAMRGSRGVIYNGTDHSEFGARQRDDGWAPQTHEEAYAWYKDVIDFAKEMLPCVPIKVKNAISGEMANSLQDLWHSGFRDAIEYCCCQMAGDNGWWRGWISLGMIKQYNEETMAPEDMDTLSRLLELTAPKGLLAQSVCFMSTDDWSLEPFFQKAPDSSESTELISKLHQLGMAASQVPDVLKIILDSLECAASNSLYFGEALAQGESERGALWPILASYMDGRKIICVQIGYLRFHKTNDAAWTLKKLRETETAETARQVIEIWSVLDSGKELLDHITSLLVKGELASSDLEWLSPTIASFSIDETSFFDFLAGVRRTQGGLKAAVDLLSLYCRRKRNLEKKLGVSPALRPYMRTLIIEFLAAHNALPLYEYDFAHVAKGVFCEDTPADEVQAFFRALPAYLRQYKSPYGGDAFVEGAVIPVARAHTKVFLDTVYEMDPKTVGNALLKQSYRESNILDDLDLSCMLAWADSCEKRVFLATFCDPFFPGNNKWSELADGLLHSADGAAALRIFATKFHPQWWSNSLYQILEKRLTLFKDLEHDHVFEAAIQEILPELERITKDMKGWEDACDKREHQQFDY